MSKTVESPDYWISMEDEPWQFSYLGVWERPEGYYMSTDSGCSCPSPWESHTEEDLTGPLTWEQVKEEARSLAGTSWRDDYASEQVEEFIREKENG